MAAERKGWVKWVVLGCSGAIVIAVLAAVAIFSVVMGSIKKSGAYQDAMEKLRATPAAVAALGEPIESGFFISGSVSVNGPSGEAELSIPVHGPQGKGTLYVEATKSAGRWEYDLLELVVAGQEQRIDILAEE